MKLPLQLMCICYQRGSSVSMCVFSMTWHLCCGGNSNLLSARQHCACLWRRWQLDSAFCRLRWLKPNVCIDFSDGSMRRHHWASLVPRTAQFHNDAINECGEGVLKHDLKEAQRAEKRSKGTNGNVVFHNSKKI